MEPKDPGRHNRSDAELLAAHVAGDRYAFEELFFRHRRRLSRLARLTSRCPEDAADALQDAMLSAHRGAGSFRHDAAVSSWLHRIVVNACLDQLRHSGTHRTAALDEYTCPVADRTAQVETAIVVRRALMRLPAGQRAAIIAVDMQGYSIGDAARRLGVAAGTVKSRCARGRAHLAVLLGGPNPATPAAPRSRSPRARRRRPTTPGCAALAITASPTATAGWHTEADGCGQ